MALKFNSLDRDPQYTCLSSDIDGTTLTGVNILWAKVLAVDTKNWYIVTAANTIAAYTLPVTATISAGDIEIGAVEIKNPTDDTRATVGANGLYVDIRSILYGSAVVTQNIAQDEALAATSFDMSNYGSGMVVTPSAWTAANIGFKVCDTEGGTYVIAKDKTGVPIQISTVATGAAGAYAIPTDILSAKFVKLWSKHLTAATEDDVNQAAARILKVMLK